MGHLLYQLEGESDQAYAHRSAKVTGTIEEILAEVWENEFIRNGLCMLCGNSGVIDTRCSEGVTMVTGPRGQNCEGVAHCICPNGRRRKQIEGTPSHDVT